MSKQKWKSASLWSTDDANEFMFQLREVAKSFGLTYENMKQGRQRRLPRCGIYFLFSNNELVYVGQSTNIYSRLGNHNKDFDEIAAIEVPQQHLKAIEYGLIAAFDPKLNGNCNGH